MTTASDWPTVGCGSCEAKSTSPLKRLLLSSSSSSLSSSSLCQCFQLPVVIAGSMAHRSSSSMAIIDDKTFIGLEIAHHRWHHTTHPIKQCIQYWVHTAYWIYDSLRPVSFRLLSWTQNYSLVCWSHGIGFLIFSFYAFIFFLNSVCVVDKNAK